MGEVIKGCGVDLIEISRITRALKRPGFIGRVYSKQEQQQLAGRPSASWGARFAAKEAVMKALGCGWQKGVGFNQISVARDPLGKPYIILAGKAQEVADSQGISKVLISLSHSKELATAYAVAVGEE